MRGGIGIRVESREVGPHEFGLVSTAFEFYDVVVLDAHGDVLGDVVLERQVDVAGCKHDGSIDRVRCREGKHETAWPVRDGSRAGDDAGRAGCERTCEFNGDIGAGLTGRTHGL